MRLLNVELLICDRCAKRFEMRLEDGEHVTGYGMVTVRNINARPVIPRNGELSCQEKRVLSLLVEGKSNKHIARELPCAEATVKVHVKNLLRKTGLKNRTQVAVLACNGNGNGNGDTHHVPKTRAQAITSDIDKTADLCPACLTELIAFLERPPQPSKGSS